MNIFCTDTCPKQSAIWLDDVRGRKMILESAQMLSTAIRYLNPIVEHPVYKTAYLNHPCTVWCRKSQMNFKWLLMHMHWLAEVHCAHHKSAELLDYFFDFYWSFTWEQVDYTPFANCTTYKHSTNTVEAYRKFMCDKWMSDVIKVTWNNGAKPSWYGDE